MKNQKSKIKNQKSYLTGFTLVEMMVSLGIFVVAMLFIIGAILGVLNIHRKAQSKKVAMDNLNFALESMSRTIRFGINYHCGAVPPLNLPNDCASGSSSLSINTSTAPNTMVTYDLSGGVIRQSFNAAPAYPITSPEVNIQRLIFRVFDSAPFLGVGGGNTSQPQVIITVYGTAGGANKPSTQSSFILETTVSQRRLDI